MPGSRDQHSPYAARTSPTSDDDPVVQWLLEGDPAIRWQVMRDLLDAPEAEWSAERARTEHEGWGARLLALRASNGLWADGACFPGTADFARATADALAAGTTPPPFPEPDQDLTRAGGQPWTSAYPVLLDLCHLGVPPDRAVMQETARLVEGNCRWEYDGLPFFAGEVDCCINAGTILIGTYLGVDVEPVVQRLWPTRCQMAAGTAGPRRGPRRDRSPARSTWSTRSCAGSARPEAPTRSGRRERGARSTCSSVACSGPFAPARRSSRSGRSSPTRRGGTTTCSRRPTTSPGVGCPTHGSMRRFSGSAPSGRRIAVRFRYAHPGADHFRFEEPDGAPTVEHTDALRVLARTTCPSPRLG